MPVQTYRTNPVCINVKTAMLILWIGWAYDRSWINSKPMDLKLPAVYISVLDMLIKAFEPFIFYMLFYGDCAASLEITTTSQFGMKNNKQATIEGQFRMSVAVKRYDPAEWNHECQ